jgi:anthranilate phosphoribosyltransferase
VIGEALHRITDGETLSRDEMRTLIRSIVEGAGSEIEVAALLTALRTRGETIDEIVGAAEAMRELAVRLPEAPADAVDTCGTGGDRSGTFNISTGSAIVVAACGVPVAKHGNRAASSRCGSADVLEALGVRVDLAPERAAASIVEVGIGFLFARTCHPAMARVAPIRAALGIPTIFNRLGPLTNPMRVRRQVVGVADPRQAEAALECLVRLGSERVWVVHAEDGLDEISPAARTEVWSHLGGRTERRTLEPGEFVPRSDPSDLLGGDVEQNAEILRAVLAGARGAPRDAVVLNAGAALLVADRSVGLAAGVRSAEEALDSGRASDALERWIEFTRKEGER